MYKKMCGILTFRHSHGRPQSSSTSREDQLSQGGKFCVLRVNPCYSSKHTICLFVFVDLMLRHPKSGLAQRSSLKCNAYCVYFPSFSIQQIPSV